MPSRLNHTAHFLVICKPHLDEVSMLQISLMKTKNSAGPNAGTLRHNRLDLHPR